MFGAGPYIDDWNLCLVALKWYDHWLYLYFMHYAHIGMKWNAFRKELIRLLYFHVFSGTKHVPVLKSLRMFVTAQTLSPSKWNLGINICIHGDEVLLM